MNKQLKWINIKHELPKNNGLFKILGTVEYLPSRFESLALFNNGVFETPFKVLYWKDDEICFTKDLK